MKLEDQIRQLMWMTGPRPLSAAEIAGGLMELFAVLADCCTINNTVRTRPCFRLEGGLVTLDKPAHAWRRLGRLA